MKKKRAKTNKKPKHSLIASGGQGCIFEPAIPCYRLQRNRKTTNRKKSRTISKVAFHLKSAKREIGMDDVIRKIPGHEAWCVVWDTLCETPPYQKVSKVSDLTKCLSKKQIKHTDTQRYPQLVGEYGGKTLYDYGEHLFTKKVFENQALFDKAFQKLVKPIHNLCEGLVALEKAGITHGDLSVRNVVVKDGKGYMIDFGLAYRFNDKAYLKKRTKFLFSLDKSYDAYPYDYILAGGTKAQIQKEVKDLKDGIFRDGHEDHRRFHEIVLGREGFNESLIQYLKGAKPKLQTIVRSLDTYSVGMLIPTILHDVADDRDVSFETLNKRCDHTSNENKKFLEMCRQMTEFAPNRPSPTEVLEMF